MAGGDPNYKGYDIDLCNDSGSTIQTITTQIWNAMEGKENYEYPSLETGVKTASGKVKRPRVVIQLRIFKDAARLHPLTDWFEEKGALNHDNGAHLLSGGEMRNKLAFATPPGNESLFVGSKLAVAWKLAFAGVPDNEDIELRKMEEEELVKQAMKAARQAPATSTGAGPSRGH
jgi:hypothetical protein